MSVDESVVDAYAPMVSVVTACLNQRRYLGETLASVAEQTYPLVEHVVVDGGSTDGTVALLEDWSSKHDIRWSTCPDRGLSHAFNRGIRFSRGEWLCFLNGDDCFVDAGVIERVMSWIQSHDAHDIYMGGIECVDEGGRPTGVLKMPSEFLIYDRDTLLHESALVNHQATFYRRNVFYAVGGYSERYKTHMDYELHLRASHLFPIASMGISVAKFRVRSEALSGRQDSRRYLELARARWTYGGRIWHHHMLFMIKGFLSTSRWTRLPYRLVAVSRAGAFLSRATGWHSRGRLD